MRSLSSFVKSFLLLEGGMGGHMSHIIDNEDFTGDDLKQLVQDLFSNKIEHMKEKLDGMNINATMNVNGEIVFIRNNKDLNSERGGMTIDDMAMKWASKPDVAKTFLSAGHTIEQVFKKIPNDWFNIDDETKRIVNCECIVAGRTNVMLYADDRVAFHGTAIYKLKDGNWVLASETEGLPKEIEKACENVDKTKPRPDLIIKDLQKSTKLANEFCNEIDKLFKDEGLKSSDTIDTLKFERFKNICPDWVDPNDVYRRFFYNDKSVKLNDLKKKYASNTNDLKELDGKTYKDLVYKTMLPIDNLFLRIGNALINLCSGFTNDSDIDNIIAQLKSDVKQIEAEIKSKSVDDDTLAKFQKNMQRLEMLNNELNAAEGIVFTYKGRLMKCTGSFAPMNQIIGLRFNL